MNTNINLWDTAEINFKDWLDNKGTGTDEVSERILKANFLIGRKNLRESISKLLKDVPTTYETDSLLREDDVPFERSEKISYSITRLDIFESDNEVSKSWEKAELPEVESFQQRNKRIVTAIISGENWPLLELYENELPKLYFFIKANSGTMDNAKDVFQDGLVILIEKLNHKQLTLTAPIESYLFGICHKLWMNQLRKMKKKVPVTEDIFAPIEEFDILETDDMEVDEKISGLIESLGDPCRTLLDYYYYRNMDWDKISRQLGYASAASARNQKFKCLERIRKKVTYK